MTVDTILLGNDELNNIEGDESNDSISGMEGNDTLIGNEGNDTLLGKSGDDKIIGGKDDDLLRGGQGDDFIRGDGGDDRIHGDEGDDVLRGGSGDDTIFGDDQHDSTPDGNDTITGGKGSDQMAGGGGEDVFAFRLTNDFAGSDDNADLILDFMVDEDLIDFVNWDPEDTRVEVSDISAVDGDLVFTMALSHNNEIEKGSITLLGLGDEFLAVDPEGRGEFINSLFVEGDQHWGDFFDV